MIDKRILEPYGDSKNLFHWPITKRKKRQYTTNFQRLARENGMASEIISDFFYLLKSHKIYLMPRCYTEK